MTFVLRMAWRETRASWLRLVFFFLCVALGVGAIVALRSVVQQARGVMTGQARTIVGGDLAIQSPRAWPAGVRDRIDEILRGAGATATTDVVETTTMALPADGRGLAVARLVEIRAVEAAFPFYGTLTLQSGRPYSHALLEQHGVIVQPELLTALGVSVGDRIMMAGQPFTIRDVLLQDRVQRTGGFALGPRVYVDLADLQATGLLGFGSRASRQMLVRIGDAGLAGAERQLNDALAADAISVTTWRKLGSNIGRGLTQVEDYLSLVGFSIVVLGGIGVWSVTRVFVQQKIRSVAVLKCLGAVSRQILGIYVVQILLLALTGSVIGVGLGAAGLRAIPARVVQALGVESAHITLSAAIQGAAVGVLVSLLFALVPLLDVRDVKPLLLLRADTMHSARRRGWQSAVAALTIGAALTGVAMWQAGSLRAGLYVSVGLGVVALALAGAGRLLVVAIAPLARTTWFPLRHAVISLGRPGNQTRVILMAVGIGCFFILGTRALQENLVEEFAVQIGPNAPDLALIDVQRDQIDGVRALLAGRTTRAIDLLPLMRARVVGVEGRRVSFSGPDGAREAGLGREYGITYRAALADNERLVDGAFWPPSAPAGGADTDVSIEQAVHDRDRVDVGDLMRFDIAGRTISARVTSIRRVTWDVSTNGGFMFVFRPAPAIARAPQTFIAFLSVAGGAPARGLVQRDLARAFPNVSVIDIRQVLDGVQDVLNNGMLAVSIVGAVTLGGGVLILIGAVAMTKFQRLYEAAIYRALGAGTRLLASMVAIEYGVLGGLAGVMGALGALGLSWAFSTRLLDITWRPAPGLLVAGVALATVLVAVVGLAASADVLVRKPMGTLRNE